MIPRSPPQYEIFYISSLLSRSLSLSPFSSLSHSLSLSLPHSLFLSPFFSLSISFCLSISHTITLSIFLTLSFSIFSTVSPIYYPSPFLSVAVTPFCLSFATFSLYLILPLHFSSYTSTYQPTLSLSSPQLTCALAAHLHLPQDSQLQK